MIYGVFYGEYSDWGVVGYFTDLEEANKWIALKNDDGYSGYYIIELEEIKLDEKLKEELKDRTIKQYCHVEFNYKENTGGLKYLMITEEDDYSITKEKEREIVLEGMKYNGFKRVVFNLTCDSREKAEKICQDIMSEIAYDYQETNSITKSIEKICPKWKLIDCR